MGRELYCEFRLNSMQQGPYWWPLIFEAMHWNGFDFTAPEELDGTGYYYYTHTHDAANTDLVRASFRTLWDEIQAEEKLLLISLWFHGQPSFPLDVSYENRYCYRLYTKYMLFILFSVSKRHSASNANTGLRAIASNIQPKKIGVKLRTHFGFGSEGGSSL